MKDVEARNQTLLTKQVNNIFECGLSTDFFSAHSRFCPAWLDQRFDSVLSKTVPVLYTYRKTFSKPLAQEASQEYSTIPGEEESTLAVSHFTLARQMDIIILIYENVDMG